MDKKAIIEALRDKPQLGRPDIKGIPRRVTDAVNRNIATLLGTPVDTVTNAINLGIAGVGTLGHKLGLVSTPPNVIENPIGGSEWFGQQMEQRGMVSPERNTYNEVMAGLLMPAATTRAAKTLFNVEQQAARNIAAPRTLNTPGFRGQRGAVYVGDKLTTNIDDANEFAQKIRNLGAQYRPNIIEDAGGSVYVTVDKLPLTKSGAVAKNRTPMPTNFKARFADHPQYWGASISSDPITQNTAEDAYQLFAHEVLGQQAPETITKAFFVPQDKVGKITEKTLKTMPSLSGKSMVQKYIEETRPFTFYEPKLNNQPMGLMGAPKQTGVQTTKALSNNLDDVRYAWNKSGVEIDAYPSRNNEINLSRIVVDKSKRNQGLGTAAMQDLIQYADDTGKTIKLSPSTDFGGTSVNRLKEFYKRFGFVENKGKNKDFTISELMYRTPKTNGLMGAPKQTGLQELTTLNPTGSVFSNYDPISRAIAPLGKNITTLDKTMGGLADDTVTIYRGAPKTQKRINPGDFITTDAQLARDYAGTGHVISQKVRKKDILDDMLEPLGGEYIYRPAK